MSTENDADREHDNGDHNRAHRDEGPGGAKQLVMMR
jgi:hypothetical protein